MTEPLATVFRRPFAEAIAALELRLANQVGTTAWDDLVRSQHDRAFMVAGAIKADLLEDLAAAVRKARVNGGTLADFTKDWRRIVEERGWHGWTGEGTPRGEAWRIRVVYQTNMRTSYMAGRLAQLREGKYPFWVYRHGGSVEPRIQHLGWDGLVLPADHPFWATHYPPNGWGCSCRVFGARSKDHAARKGGDPAKELEPGWNVADPRTGAPPGIDRNWDYAPGGTVSETVSFAAKKISALSAELGSDYGTSIAPMIDTAWPVWLADTLMKGTQQPGLAGVMSREVLAALATRSVAPRTAEVLVRPGLLTGPKAARHERKGDALTPEDWLSLPWRLRKPQAVLLDRQSGRLIYILPGRDRLPQIAIELDGTMKVDRVVSVTNAIVSGYRVRMTDLAGRISGGLLEVLLGGLG
jgi:hypothetical protein